MHQVYRNMYMYRNTDFPYHNTLLGYLCTPIQIKTLPKAKKLFKMLFSHVNVGSAQLTLYGAVSFVPTTKKNHVVKTVVMWSISLGYQPISIRHICSQTLHHSHGLNKGKMNKCSFQTYFKLCPA